MFTDIVGSTELASELGDERWKQVLATHHGVVRKTLKRYNGREVDTAGDGFFATFDKPAEAIRCASDIIDQLRPIGIQIRAGVHIGEVEQMGPKVGGIAVHIGARVASKASASEILVSSTVRDLVAGSDIRFADRGDYDLKGVPGEWHLYSIDRELAGEVPARPAVDAPAAKAARRRTVPALTVVVAAVVVVAIVIVALVVARGGSSNVVAVPGANTISKIDTASGRFAGTETVGLKPSAAVFGGGSIWVLNGSDQTISRVDPSAVKLLSSRAVGGTPTGVAYGAGSLWVTTQFGLTSGAPGSVLRIDPGEPALSKPPITVGSGAGAVSFGEGSLWVANSITNMLTRIDPNTNSIAGTVAVGKGPQDIVVGNGAVWVANALDDSIWKIDPKSGAVVSKVTLTASPTALALDGSTLWVASQIANTLTRIDATTGTTVATITVGGQPSDVVAGPGGVWVSEDSAHSVIQVDPKSNRIVRRLAVDGSPGGLVMVGRDVWVTVGS